MWTSPSLSRHLIAGHLFWIFRGHHRSERNVAYKHVRVLECKRAKYVVKCARECPGKRAHATSATTEEREKQGLVGCRGRQDRQRYTSIACSACTSVTTVVALRLSTYLLQSTFRTTESVFSLLTGKVKLRYVQVMYTYPSNRTLVPAVWVVLWANFTGERSLWTLPRT